MGITSIGYTREYFGDSAKLNKTSEFLKNSEVYLFECQVAYGLLPDARDAVTI